MTERSFIKEKDKSLRMLGFGIILFWAAWSSLVALTDSINFLQEMGWLPKQWVFTSSNYDLVAKSIGIYGWSNKSLTLSLFLIIILFAWLIAGTFWRAVFASKEKRESYLQKCYTAFIMSFAIEAFFILADEIFIQYNLEHGHMDRLGFKLITFLIFWMLERSRQA